MNFTLARGREIKKSKKKHVNLTPYSNNLCPYYRQVAHERFVDQIQPPHFRITGRYSTLLSSTINHEVVKVYDPPGKLTVKSPPEYSIEKRHRNGGLRD